MTTTYRLNVDELSNDVLKSIKEAFKGKDIQITVAEIDELEDEMDVTIAMDVLHRIEEGKEKLHSWENVKKSLR